MAKGADDNDRTYQIWSSVLDNEDMIHPTHGKLFSKHEEGGSGGRGYFKDDVENSDDGRMENTKGEDSDEENEEQTRKCFVTTAPKSPMTEKVRDLLVSLNVPLNSYHDILSDFDETCSYLNDMLISMSSEAEKPKASLNIEISWKRIIVR